MVKLPGGYCMDRTEVTRGQYAAWLATHPSLAGQPPACEFNQTFDPDATCMADAAVYKGPHADQHPQTCVDWCDATAYCRGVGKRLCGGIGGGALEFTAWNDASKSQWYAACSSGGTRSYPYGDTYEPTTCNGKDAAKGFSVEVGTMAGCQSDVAGYEGVYDLSGNAVEFEDSCLVEDDPPWPGTWCNIRGGGFMEDQPAMACDAVPFAMRVHDVARSVGFRCCWP